MNTSIRPVSFFPSSALPKVVCVISLTTFGCLGGQQQQSEQRSSAGDNNAQTGTIPIMAEVVAEASLSSSVIPQNTDEKEDNSERGDYSLQEETSQQQQGIINIAYAGAGVGVLALWLVYTYASGRDRSKHQTERIKAVAELAKTAKPKDEPER